MIEHKAVGTLSGRNQITLPAQVRRHLGVQGGDKLAFTIHDTGEVILQRAVFDLEAAYGSVTPLEHPEDFEARIRDAKDEKAEQLTSPSHGTDSTAEVEGSS